MPETTIRTTSSTSNGNRPPKVSAACEPCRKRKVRCSGKSPCTICQRQRISCVFDFDRRRRGPAPKCRSRTTEENRPKTHPCPNDTEGGKPTSPVTNPAATIVTVHPGPISYLLSEGWIDALDYIVGEDGCNLSSVKISNDQITHLLTVFFSTVNQHQGAIILPTQFVDRLLGRECHPCLIYSMCASSVQFSKHPRLTSNNPTLISAQFAAKAREEMHTSDKTCSSLERLQATCILLLYECSRGNGFQAWYDLTTALGLMQAMMVDTSIPSVILTAIELAQYHLCIVKPLLTLGHHGITVNKPTKSTHLIDLSNGNNLSPDCRAVLHGLFDVMLQIQYLSRLDFTVQSPAPWASDSDLIFIKRELDGYRMRFPEELSFDKTIFKCLLDQETGAGEYILCSLTWHCCHLLLYRVFLPIPLVASSKSKEAHGRSNRTAAQPSLLDFPMAPKLFVQQAINSCWRHADAIVRICSEIMEGGTLLLPSFLGYCCFISGVVLINLHRSRRVTKTEKIVSNLKIIFTILGFMRKHFSPAHAWVDTLMKIHSPDTQLAYPSKGSSTVFANYFSRFQDLVEPPFVPLNSKPDVQPQHESTVDNLQESYTPKSDPKAPEKEVQQPIQQEHWSFGYRRLLQEELAHLDSQSSDQAQDSSIQVMPLLQIPQVSNMNSPIDEQSRVQLNESEFAIEYDLPHPVHEFSPESDTSLSLEQLPSLDLDFFSPRTQAELLRLGEAIAL